MNYGIKIECKYPYQKLMKGIYRIEIGHKFYIGMATRFGERMYQHEMDINKCLRNFTMPRQGYAHYLRIARYLHENPRIEYCYAEIIQKCVTGRELYFYEDRFLKDAKGNRDCLNTAFYSTKRSFGLPDTWDIKPIDGILHYFDPSNPEVKPIHIYTPLNRDGSISKPRVKK